MLAGGTLLPWDPTAAETTKEAAEMTVSTVDLTVPEGR
jgi:hypothetical protein